MLLFGKLVFVMCDIIEWLEVVVVGMVWLVGIEIEWLVGVVVELWEDGCVYWVMSCVYNLYGDGCVSGWIVDLFVLLLILM